MSSHVVFDLCSEGVLGNQSGSNAAIIKRFPQKFGSSTRPVFLAIPAVVYVQDADPTDLIRIAVGMGLAVFFVSVGRYGTRSIFVSVGQFALSYSAAQTSGTSATFTKAVLLGLYSYACLAVTPTHMPCLDCSGMTDITVKILKGQVEIASVLISSPATAGETKSHLTNTTAKWRGKLTEVNSGTGIVGQRLLTPGETYHLHLQRHGGKYYNTVPAH